MTTAKKMQARNTLCLDLNKKALVFALLCFSILSASCSDEKQSPEDEIKQYIETGKAASEKRDHGELAELIHPAYQDQNAYNKKQLVKMLRAYFFTHNNIHLFIKVDDIILQNEKQAFVTLHVAMAGNAIADINALSRLRARIYRFELLLVRDDAWLLQQAKWQAANLSDIL